ncbi:MAG: enoyl-CoA hydratase/isomerase family protein [Rhodospirillaceae bacterium]|nr:enoyl-CoA hydratase/isomerase family protein [Rhodospirillaceae bacterium]
MSESANRQNDNQADDSIHLQQVGGVYRLTLNRPQRLNALTREMLSRISDALADIAADAGARLLVITGAGRAFSAGQDLTDKGAIEDGRACRNTVERYYNPVIRQIHSLELPVVAAVNGIAAGAGVSLALACDIVIAVDSAAFDIAFARIGLIPDAGGTHQLQRLLGPARARALAMLGEKLAAPEAARLGLIHRAVADDTFEAEVNALAQRLAEGPTRALALMKQAFHAGDHHSLEQQLALEAELQAQAADSEDFAEGLAAFLAKRAPRFKGM